MKRILQILFFSLCLSTAFAQKAVIDSLYQALQATRNDTLKLVLSQRLSWEWMNINSDSSIAYADRYQQFAQNLGYPVNEADALRLKGFNYFYLGNHARSLEILLDGLKVLQQESGLLPSKFVLLLNPGFSAGSIEKYDVYIEGHLHNVLALVYWANRSEKQHYHFDKLFLFAESNGADDLKVFALFGRGINAKNKDSAIILFSKGYHIAMLQKDFKFQGPIAEYVGAAYHDVGDHRSEYSFLQKGAWLNVVNGNIRNSGWSYIKLAEYFSERENLDSMIHYAQKALGVGKNGHYPDIELAALRQIAGVYNVMNNKDSANKYLTVLAQLTNSSVSSESVRQFQNVELNRQAQEQEVLSTKERLAAKGRLYSVLAGLLVLLVIALILWRNNRQKNKANEQLQYQKNKLQKALQELKSTQAQLIQSEKMASLGELTAGIAHEIQNPLNFVNNFSEVNKELADELSEEIDKGNYVDAKLIAKDIKENEEKINHHGKRADAIVKGMLLHSRSSSGVKEPTDINALCDEYLRLSYHGLRAKDKSLSAGQAGFNATLQTDYDATIGKINIIPQDIGRVLLNLYNNAFYTVAEKMKQQNGDYEPTVSVSTKKIADKVEIRVADNGTGIPQKVLDKIYQPFFTTKLTGQGTGLGLSMSYDIIKAHGGEIKVETQEGEGSTFIIQFPF